jgi:methionyl-tRNA formyltransferase
LGLTVAHSLQTLAEVDVELGIVVAYGVLIKPDVLNKTPMLNVHFSLLPRWRGAAPVERAILAGDAETGVGIMSLEPTLDTGPLHAERRVAVEEKTASALTAELAEVGAGLLVEVLASPELLQNARPQVGEATYAEKLDSSTFHLIPTMSAVMAERVVRLERAWCMVAGKRLRVLRASTSDFEGNPGSVVRDGSQPGLSFEGGTLWLDEVQPEGSRPMAASAWLAGARLDDHARWS